MMEFWTKVDQKQIVQMTKLNFQGPFGPTLWALFSFVYDKAFLARLLSLYMVQNQLSKKCPFIKMHTRPFHKSSTAQNVLIFHGEFSTRHAAQL